MKCPNCGYITKPFQHAVTGKQVLFGGWTCPSCASEMNWRGKIVNKGKMEDSPIFKEEYLKEKARLKAFKDSKKEKHSTHK